MLWNTPAALPPPNAGDLPIIKGKNCTVRQGSKVASLGRLRPVATPRSTPLGLAAGKLRRHRRWRERQNGEDRKGSKNDPPINPSIVMPSSQSLHTLPEFKRILVHEKAQFYKGFTEKLLAYSLRPARRRADRGLVNGILEEHRQGGAPFAGDDSGDPGEPGVSDEVNYRVFVTNERREVNMPP